MPCSDNSVTIVSRCRVYPDERSTLGDLKLSVSDLPMLSCHYIQKGCLFTRPPLAGDALAAHVKHALSQALLRFPPLSGRLVTDADGHTHIACNDEGADFVLADARDFHVRQVLGPLHVLDFVKGFFAFNGAVSYAGHHMPIMAVQVTELADGVFIGCSVNHAVADGTSFWNFFNTFAGIARGSRKLSSDPDFTRDSVLISRAVLQIPDDGPKVSFDVNQPLRERIFSFSRDAIQEIKAIVNKIKCRKGGGEISAAELLGKQSNDKYSKNENGKITEMIIESLFGKNGGALKNSGTATPKTSVEISSFQSLCALLWRAITRARKLPTSKTTTFRMAVNCRHRLCPKLHPYYFGNAIQSVPTFATAGDVLSRDLRWCAEQLNRSIVAHDDGSIRRQVAKWELDPKCFPLGNFDGASITMGSSPRFPMYDNDFGWGRPLAVRSGKANKFDGKISAFPGREGAGSVDLEVVLAPGTMAAIECDSEFMKYVSSNQRF